MAVASAPAPSTRPGLLNRISTALYTRPWLLLLLLFALPLGYMIVVYLGSLVALLIQSFYRLDDFSGKVVPEFTLKNYLRCCSRATWRSSFAPSSWPRP